MIYTKGFEQARFDECFSYASIAKVKDVEVPFLQKKVTNCSKDQIDVTELEKIRDSR
jgi:hypothetical protein